jgi:RNA recognition motif-containing protein
LNAVPIIDCIYCLLLIHKRSLQDYSEDKIATIKNNLAQGLAAVERAPARSNKKGEFTLFVGNLPFSFMEPDLTKMFSEYGEVASAVIIKDPMQRSRGFGFVEMAVKADGEKALSLNNFELNGRPISVRDGSQQNSRESR